MLSHHKYVKLCCLLRKSGLKLIKKFDDKVFWMKRTKMKVRVIPLFTLMLKLTKEIQYVSFIIQMNLELDSKSNRVLLIL